MYRLSLTCDASQVEWLSAELWEAGTMGVREIAHSPDAVQLEATFEDTSIRETLLGQFASFEPVWEPIADRDWTREAQLTWPGREIGEKLYLAAPWCADPTPSGRQRIIHNPGLACGTGEHPCTQLALEALEAVAKSGVSVIDIGTGSGVLAIAALTLGAGKVIGLDLDLQALIAAKENFAMNALQPALAAGTADCLANASADVIMANINASVLLDLADDFLRTLRPDGWLILTGFPVDESHTLEQVFQPYSKKTRAGWSCLTCRSSFA